MSSTGVCYITICILVLISTKIIKSFVEVFESQCLIVSHYLCTADVQSLKHLYNSSALVQSEYHLSGSCAVITPPFPISSSLLQLISSQYSISPILILSEYQLSFSCPVSTLPLLQLTNQTATSPVALTYFEYYLPGSFLGFSFKLL